MNFAHIWDFNPLQNVCRYPIRLIQFFHLILFFCSRALIPWRLLKTVQRLPTLNLVQRIHSTTLPNTRMTSLLQISEQRPLVPVVEHRYGPLPPMLTHPSPASTTTPPQDDGYHKIQTELREVCHEKSGGASLAESNRCN